MSFDWTAQPLSLKSITEQCQLPVVVRSAPGYHGSSRPILLHSLLHVKFALGKALRLHQPTNKRNTYQTVDSELIAIPIKYPGYFECLPSSKNSSDVGVSPVQSVRTIIEKLEKDNRSQAYYVASPMRVYTIENGKNGAPYRVWHQIDDNQIVLFESTTYVFYTPTEDDDLTDDDYALSWWFCYGKEVLERKESVLKCILSTQDICYIPCSSTDEINLIPIGQYGSTNKSKLQTIKNLIDHFPVPINLKLSTLPGSYAYKDFKGALQLLGVRSETFVVCASLSSSNIVAIPMSTPLKLVVSQTTAPTPQIQEILSSCHIFIHSFDMQIRRIVKSFYYDTSSHRSRSRQSKDRYTTRDQEKHPRRSFSIEKNSILKDDHTTDDGYRSGSSTIKEHDKHKKTKPNRAESMDRGDFSTYKRTVSTDDESIYDSFVHHNRKRSQASLTSPIPPALPKKPPNFPFPTNPTNSNGRNDLIDDIDSSDSYGSIIIDRNHELFLVLTSDSRFT